MKFSDKSFTVGSTSREAKKNYDANYDRIFGKKCEVCGQSRDTPNPCDDAFHLPVKDE